MTVEELMVILETKINTLNEVRQTAANNGDAEQCQALDCEICKTEDSLASIKTLIVPLKFPPVQ